MLVLTQQLRVSDGNSVLRLEPEQAVDDEDTIDIHEEPPLSVVEGAGDTSGPLELTEEVRLPTIEVPRTTETEFMDLSAKIAALETAIATTADQWEPDGAGRDAYAGTQPPAMEWREGVELDGTGQPLGQAERDRGETPAEMTPETTTAEDHVEWALEEQVIDEEMLREMVAEIVRSELQGDMGVRITRNIRKLVRSEVHRALMAQSVS